MHPETTKEGRKQRLAQWLRLEAAKGNLLHLFIGERMSLLPCLGVDSTGVLHWQAAWAVPHRREQVHAYVCSCVCSVCGVSVVPGSLCQCAASVRRGCYQQPHVCSQDLLRRHRNVLLTCRVSSPLFAVSRIVGEAALCVCVYSLNTQHLTMSTTLSPTLSVDRLVMHAMLQV